MTSMMFLPLRRTLVVLALSVIAWPAAGVTWIVFLGEQFVDEARILLGRTAP